MNPLLAERSDIQRRKTIMTHHSRESFVPQSSAQVWSLGEEGENKLLFRLERERERKDRGREGGRDNIWKSRLGCIIAAASDSTFSPAAATAV